MRIAAVLSLGLVASTAVASGQAVAPDSVVVARLAALGRLYGVVKYFHPAFLSRNVSWDSAVVATIPRVAVARSTHDYTAAVSDMLGALHDPTTRVLPRVALPPVRPSSAGVTTRWAPESTLVVSIPTFFNDFYPRIAAAQAQLRSARRIVFDLRGPSPLIYGEADDKFASAGLNSLLVSGAIAAPIERRRMYLGYPWAANERVAQAFEGGGQVFRGLPRNPARRVAFVIFAESDVPPVAWALQNSGDASIVLDDRHGSVVDISTDASTSLGYTVSLGEQTAVEVRTAEVVGSATGTFTADTVARTTAAADTPLDAALALVGRATSRRSVAPSNEAFVAQPEDAYREPIFPDLPYRVLAAYRYWTAIQFFYPSGLPKGEDWDAVLPAAIANLMRARDAHEYALAIAEMVAHVHDHHAVLTGGAYAPYRGQGHPRLQLQYVEGLPVVVRVEDDSATKASGIRVGDVIVRVDGEDASARRSRIARYVSASTQQDLDLKVSGWLPDGAPGTAQVIVRGFGDTLRAIALPRTSQPCGTCSLRTGPVFHILDGNIGYADIARLEVAMVDSMFALFRNTVGIVFDGRGYSRGSQVAIAPRLTDRDGIIVARFTRPLVRSPDPSQRTTTEGTMALEFTNKSRYRGRTVLLIDERAYSQGEQVAQMFETANGTTLIGSRTAGGIGGVTGVDLPGGLRATFPGSESRHADGRPVLRVGIVPDIEVRPTIAGVRAGRDEVLERAILFLRSASR